MRHIARRNSLYWYVGFGICLVVTVVLLLFLKASQMKRKLSVEMQTPSPSVLTQSPSPSNPPMTDQEVTDFVNGMNAIREDPNRMMYKTFRANGAISFDAPENWEVKEESTLNLASFEDPSGLVFGIVGSPLDKDCHPNLDSMKNEVQDALNDALDVPILVDASQSTVNGHTLYQVTYTVSNNDTNKRVYMFLLRGDKQDYQIVVQLKGPMISAKTMADKLVSSLRLDESGDIPIADDTCK